MKRAIFTTTMGAGLAVGWLLLFSPVPLTAQEAPAEQQGNSVRHEICQGGISSYTAPL